MMMTAAGGSDIKQSSSSKNFAPTLSEVIGKSSNSSNETVIASVTTKPSAKPNEQTTMTEVESPTTTSGRDGGSKLAALDTPTTRQQQQQQNNSIATADNQTAEDVDPNRGDPIDNYNSNENENEKQRGKLKSFLMITASHLNPFHNNSNNNNNDANRSPKRAVVSCNAASEAHVENDAHNLEVSGSEDKRKSGGHDDGNDHGQAARKKTSSNNNSKAKHRNYLGLIGLGHHLQRYFIASYRNHGQANFNKNESKQPAHGLSEDAASAGSERVSKSAPVTPIRWRPLEGEMIRANGYTSSSSNSGSKQMNDQSNSDSAGKQVEGDQPPASTCKFSCSNGRQPTLAAANGGGAVSPVRPSVRFVDNAGRMRDGTDDEVKKPEVKADDDGDDADDRASKLLSIEEEASNLVAKLFKLPPPPVPDDLKKDGLEEGESPMNSDKFRQYGYSLIDYISNYLDTIDKRRVTPLNIVPGYLKSLIQPDAPVKGESFANIMHDFENHIMCGITHWQHPHFHAYFPAGNAYPSILADLLSDALGCVGFSWAASPAYTELEIIMLDWMGKMIGLPDEFLCLSGGRGPGGQDSKGGGVIQGSASECVLVNLLAARHWAMEKLRKRYPNTQDGILLSKLIGYCSKEAHSCVEKAAMIGFIRMRALDTDEKHSLRGETLAKAMAMDQANGLEPFIVCATLGTTSCVSFDNLEELGQVCQRHDVWLHVDAAYAGSALICPEFKYLMKGIERANSFNMNPNKWMLINFDCSLMWVKDRFKLTRAFVVDPLYLQHSFSDQAIDYRHWGIPLSRRFRALKLWFVIRNYGVEGLQAYIRNHVRLAKLFEQCIKQDTRFSITNEVVLGLVCFRLVGSNALNQRLLSMINASGKLHMVPASLNGRYVIRFCVCDRQAKEADILYAYRCISEFATELFDSIRAGRERIRAISQQNTIDVSNISLHRQQSASADRLNNMAHVDGGDGSQETDSSPLHGHPNNKQVSSVAGSGAQQVPSAAAAAAGTQGAVSPREAARHYLMMRRNSRGNGPSLQPADQLPVAAGASVTPLSARTSPASYVHQSSLSAKSPLTKQASVQHQQQDHQPTDEDLEQEVVLDSLATIDGYEYDLDDDDLLEPPGGLFGDETGGEAATGSEQVADQQQQQQPDESNGWRSPVARHWSSRAGRASRNQTLGGPASGLAGEHDEAEAEDEVFTLAERRQRMSLRYKREFFVRVVSDPRVYRASISGDINAHSSSCSLGGSQQQQQVNSATTSVPSETQSGEASSSDELGKTTTAAATPMLPPQPSSSVIRQ